MIQLNLTSLALTLAACSSSAVHPDAQKADSALQPDAPSPATQIVGTVKNRAFDAKDAIAANIPNTNGFSFSGPATFVQISDFGNACDLSMKKQGPTNSRILVLGIGVIDSAGQSTVPGPGMYIVHDHSQPLPSSTNSAQVYYGSGCGKDVAYDGVSGTVIVTSAVAGVITGTFDVTISCQGFGNCAGPDEHLTGKFTTSACSGLEVNVTATCISAIAAQ